MPLPLLSLMTRAASLPLLPRDGLRNWLARALPGDPFTAALLSVVQQAGLLRGLVSWGISQSLVPGWVRSYSVWRWWELSSPHNVLGRGGGNGWGGQFYNTTLDKIALGF